MGLQDFLSFWESRKSSSRISSTRNSNWRRSQVLLQTLHPSSFDPENSLGRLIGVYLRILVDNGFLQLKKRVAGELQFQPTETEQFALLNGKTMKVA